MQSPNHKMARYFLKRFFLTLLALWLLLILVFLMIHIECVIFGRYPATLQLALQPRRQSIEFR